MKTTQVESAYGAGLPEKALVVTFGAEKGSRVVMVFRFRMGYHDYRPSSIFDLDINGATDEELWKACDEMNRDALDCTPAQARAMLAGSMLRWHVPAAHPDSYTEEGDYA